MRNPEDLLADIHQMKYQVTDCPIDHQSHAYTLEVKYHRGIVIEGLERRIETAIQKPVEFTCPNTHKTFVDSVAIPQIKDAQIEDVSVIPDIVTSPTHPPTGTDSPTSGSTDDKGSDSVITDEFKAWVSGSAQTARDYSKTMISTATGAVAVFYAVLTFLGIGGGKAPLSSIPGYPLLGVLPPIAFLASAIVFVAAFQPHTKLINNIEDFITFRNQRLQHVDTLIAIGTVLFLSGVALAIAAYAVVIFK